MSDSDTPFVKWGDFKSTDSNNPDKLSFKVSEIGTFESDLSINVNILRRDGTELQPVILPLKSHSSTNAALLNKWNNLVKAGKLKSGVEFDLLTWLGRSTKSSRNIRRFAFRF